MWQVVRFWLDLGVDGFRLDAVSTIFEHPDLPDHTLPKSADEILDANALSMADYQRLMHFQLNQPGIHELMQELRAIMNEYPGDRMLIGEDEDPAYHGSGDDELQLVFNFPLMRRKPLTPVSIRANQARRLGELPPGSWPCNTLGNHDSPRLWSHYGDGAHNAEIAQLHLALILTLKGTPFLYYGEEIGMTDLELISLEQIRDSKALKQYQQMTERLGIAPEAALKAALANTRDRCRTPMQWNTSANAGFSPPGIQTWLPVNPNYANGVNVADQESNPGSLLNFYRRLLRLRQATPALNSGEYEVLHPHSKTYLAFLRHAWLGDQTCLVVLNFSNERQEIHFGLCIKPARLLFSSHERENVPISLDPLSLAPYEICIIDVSDFRD